jgi:hypothetical protein
MTNLNVARRWVAGVLMVAGLVGCAPGGGAGGDDASNVAQVSVALTNVPPATTCIGFSIANGTTTTQQLFTVTPNQTATLLVKGLPPGKPLTLTASAYASACTAVTGSTPATWLSDPVAVTLTVGQTASLSFTLRPTANVSGGVDFLFLTMTPATQAFGTAFLGVVPTTAPGLTSFAIKNVGTTATGTLAASLTGASAADFRLGTNTCTATLAAGATCNVQVKFVPATSGNKTANLQVTGAPGGTITAALTGVGVTPAKLTLSPTSQDFGSVAVTQSSPDATFVVTNTGGVASGPVTVTSLGATFLVSSSNCAAALAPAATCSVTVRFVPAAQGAVTASLTATATPGGSVVAALSATGVAAPFIQVVPGTLSFAPTIVGGSSQAPLMIVNSGGVPVGPFTVQLGGANPGDFGVVGNGCNVVLAPNTNCIIQMITTPTTGGQRTATVLIAGPPGLTSMATLTVIVPLAQLTIFPSGYDFGTVSFGSTGVSTPFTVQNVGGSPSGPVNVISTSTAFDTINNTCGPSLAVGQECFFNARFTPSSSGLTTGGIHAQAFPGGDVGVSLSGSGSIF